MKSMLVPPEKHNVKRKIQKPNILRKNSKLPASNPNKLETTRMKQNACQLSENNKNGNLYIGENTAENFLPSEALEPLIRQGDDPVMNQGIVSNFGDTKMNANSSTTHTINSFPSTMVSQFNVDKTGEGDTKQTHVNIEAFFNDSPVETLEIYDIEYDSMNKEKNVIVDKTAMDGVFIEENQEMSMIPSSTVTIRCEDEHQTIDSETAIDVNSLPTTLMALASGTQNSKVKAKEQKAIRRRNIYTECPVKKTEPDGTQISCGKIFNVRELLARHLNEEHTIEDAVYRCDDCGRRFFWLSGLRAHTRSHCRRSPGPPLACTWAGCGRVFRHPCRLREHARAHTGDRPYPCLHPNCGWSFRSASKLVRHARQHTGERRHACTLCPRAFLRREHLRDHDARYHASPRRAHACSHEGCEQTFNNMSTLYMHMKKVHKNKAISMTETAITETTTGELHTAQENSFLLNLEESEALGPVSVAVCENTADSQETYDAPSEEPDAGEEQDAGEGHSARTHLTWPLQRAQPVTIDDYNAEQSEDNSENNIYTVRSDLFLHGNVLINEDSVPSGGTSSAGTVLDNDLGILDAHPTVDLMQEELLYTDVATDESSFRIFLLSGEELT